MMSIVLNYKDCKLGKLDYFCDKYIYNSFESEKEALDKYVGLINYDLQNSVNIKSDLLFDFFQIEFLDKINIRKDLVEKLKNNTCNDYEVLEKLSKLKTDRFSFWLSND